MTRFVEVAVDFKSEPAKTFTYVVPDNLDAIIVGSLIRVPFGSREINGVVFKVSKVPEYPDPLPIIKVVNPHVLLTEIQIDLAIWISRYYLCSLYDAAALMLPIGQRHIGKVYVDFNKSFADYTLGSEKILVTKKDQLLDYLFQNAPVELNHIAKKFGFGTETEINRLVSDGVLNLKYRNYSQITQHKFVDYVYMPWRNIELVSIQIKKLNQRGYKQAEALKSFSKISMPLPEAYKEFGRYAINKLLKEQFLQKQKVKLERSPLSAIKINSVNTVFNNNWDLTDHQKLAVNEIDESMENYRFENSLFLVHGVTGSGKTEVYAQAIKKCLSLGKKAILVVPEISLTRQTIEYLGSRFPGSVTVLHSYMTLGQRFDQWRGIAEGKYSVVIGSRSAIFAPVKNLGLIVVDEEHEWTYKQMDSAPRYNTKDVAVKLAELSKSTLVLGSATPECTTYQRTFTKKIKLLKLPFRVSNINDGFHDMKMEGSYGRNMPDIEIIDMKNELVSGNRDIFSNKLLQYLTESLEKGSQSILFLNRRGSFSSMQCRKCGSLATCARCNLPYTYHSQLHKLICHRCSRRRRFYGKCLKCGANEVYYGGIGTQQVIANLNRHFPEVSTIRWDSDTAKNIKEHERILEEFRSNSAQILVGTQMIAKGLHFPNVTLVGVVLADLGLYTPDFRAGERTFQILSQVAGRSGRGSEKGNVLIQTYSPSNYAIQCAAAQNYELFYKKEMAYRKQQASPPYSKLIKFLYSHQDMQRCVDAGERLVKLLRYELDGIGDVTNEVFGPSPAYPPKIRGKYRWQVVLKGDQPKRIINNLRIPTGWVIDVDPAN